MTKYRWEAIEKTGFQGGGSKAVATLTCDANAPILLIGSYLKDAGFDTRKRYELLFDRKRMVMGLRPSTRDNAFKVMQSHNDRATHVAHSIRTTGFCKKFGLIGTRYVAESVSKDGDIWVLQLVEA